MDKNNDIKVNKISKWEAAPKNMGTLFTYINLVIGMACSLPSEIRDNLYDLMDKALDEYNELEAVHHKDTGMISQYEEENRNLKSELDIKTDECDALISRVFKQDDEYTELKEKNKELRETCELLNKVNSKQYAEVDDLEAELKQVIDLAKSYGLIIYDDRKDAKSDDIINIGMCGHYYVLGGRNKEESKDIKKLEKKWKNAENTIKELMQVLNYEHIDVSHSKSSWTIHNRALAEKTEHFNIQLNNLREIIRNLKADNSNLQKQIDDKNKLIEELRQKIEDLESENKSLDFKCHMIKTIGYGGHIIPLKEKIQTLEKENKDLKDLLEKDESFGKNIGKRVAESIREGCDKGAYELHPLTRIDIHVEETNNMPTTFDRHAIPRIAVMFNNTQTEMERDTAQHECEELEKKFKELERENKSLRRTVRFLDEVGSYEFHSCPVSCECENFKPKG